MREEEWKDIPLYEGLYKASTFGNIKSIRRVIEYENNGTHTLQEVVLKVSLSSKGYWAVNLSKKNIMTRISVHRLIAKTFIPNPMNKPCVNHIDGNKLNNHVENLEWVTHGENHKHAFRLKLRRPPCLRGESVGNSILLETDIISIRKRKLSGEHYKSIAKDYPQVHFKTIERVWRGKSWKHIQI